MKPSILVLGAGMVGTCTALHLQQRGFDVTLVDRREPGRETSFGNAGLIQREAVEPYAFPRDPAFLRDVILGRGAHVHWHAGALWRMAGALLSYYRHSHPLAHARAAAAYSRLITHAIAEHAPLIAAAQADDLVVKTGYRAVFRSARAFEEARQAARRVHEQFDVPHTVHDGEALAHDEPALRMRMAGAIHWLDPWAVRDPGALVQRYAELFVARGGRLLSGDADSLRAQGRGWAVQTQQGTVDAQHAVVALGPWSDAVIRSFGYRYPLFIKRGYHQHYRGGTAVRLPLLDAERGYVLAPMQRGLRLTTGAELARIDAVPTPVQVGRAEVCARELVALGDALPEPPWLGARPCTADMLPVIGPAPRHAGLWFNFGHAHQGFTLGPVSGRLLSEMIAGEGPCVDPQPYAPSRFRA